MSRASVPTHNQRVLAGMRAAALIGRARHGPAIDPVAALDERLREAVRDKREQLLLPVSWKVFRKTLDQIERWEQALRLNR